MKLNREGVALNAEERNKRNQNWTTLETEVTTVSDAVKEALPIAEEALGLSGNLQAQINTLVVEGDSSVEAKQARVDAKGVEAPTLKARLDAEQQATTQQLADKAVKSEVRKDTATQPINVSEMDTETKQLFTGGSVAVVGVDAVGAENVKSKAITFSKLSDDAKSGMSSLSAKRSLLGSTQNLILMPPGEIPISNYAAQIGDVYFQSLQASSTTPAGSISINKRITLATSGFFFYRLNAIDKLKAGEHFSFFIKGLTVQTATKIEYRFIDSETVTVGSITPFTDFGDGVYGAEGVLIPANADRIEIRLDNRGTSADAVFENPVFVAGSYLGAADSRVDLVRSDILTINNDLIAMKSELGSDDPTIPVRTPVDFTWKSSPLENRIFTDGKDGFYTNFDVAEMMNAGGTDYYVAPNGLSTNDGLTPSTPLATPNQAISKVDVGTVWVKGGNYHRNSQGASAVGTVEKNVNVVGYDGIVRCIQADASNYSKTADYTNVYQVGRTSVGRVIDLSLIVGEDYAELKNVGSISLVDSTPGSYHTSGGIVYVHTHDSRAANSDVCPLLTTTNTSVNNVPTNVYFENIEFIGGSRPLQLISETGNVFAKNCKFVYGTQSNGNGFEIIGGGIVIAQGCTASKNPMDGFNYHKSASGLLPYFIEIDCIGRNNGILVGTGGQRSDNGTTAHDGVKGIRINSKFYRNDGGNVADVNPGTETWNLGVVAFESFQGSDFLATNNGAKMWLDGCKAFGSTNSLSVADATSTAYVRGGQYQKENIVGSKVLY